MAEDIRTYRHEATGHIQRLSPRVAAADPRLIEVEDGAKPLGYLPIPQEAVEEYLASQPDDDPADDAEDEEN